MKSWDERIDALCIEFGLGDFERYVIDLTLKAETDERVSVKLREMNVDEMPTLSVALRLYSETDEEYFESLTGFLRHEKALGIIFSSDLNNIRVQLALNPEVKRYIMGIGGSFNFGLGALAKRVPTAFTWDDIILPETKIQALKNACYQVKYRDTVYGSWGFGGKFADGRGVRMLFSGPSGTGKTMAAQVVANELNLDLYRVDISSVVNKYIGETEKNMAALFDCARHCVLFFDEAEAIFGKRGEQKDSHDRFANMQTAYLLQRLEEHEGVIILATNFSQNFDAAFARRIQNKVEFYMPPPELRRMLWESLLIKTAPFTDDINIASLAERYDLTGASIKNIVLSAAFSAAAMGGSIGMSEINAAMRAEFEKNGRIFEE